MQAQPDQLLIRNLPVALKSLGEDPQTLVASHLGVAREHVTGAQVIRRSLDARRGKPRFILSIQASIQDPPDPLPAGTAPQPAEKKLDPPPGGSRQPTSRRGRLRTGRPVRRAAPGPGRV